MRVLKFARIDLIKVWRFFYVLLFPVIAVVIEARNLQVSGVFGVVYCLFVSIILAALPFRVEDSVESGFLQMLPAKPGEQVLGHFAFGLITNLAGFALGILSACIARVINPAAALFSLEGMRMTGFYPTLLGIALVFTGLEALLMTVLRFRSVHASQLLRTIPGFVFFFGVNQLTVESRSDLAVALRALSGPGGLAALAVCLLAFVTLAWIASRISAARGQS